MMADDSGGWVLNNLSLYDEICEQSLIMPLCGPRLSWSASSAAKSDKLSKKSEKFVAALKESESLSQALSRLLQLTKNISEKKSFCNSKSF